MYKKLTLLFCCSLMIVTLFLGFVVKPVSAAPMAWPKSGSITCDNAFAGIKNDTNNTLVGRGWAKANGNYVVDPFFDWDVSPGETFTVSWNPPNNFIGSVEIHVELWKGMSRQDQHTVQTNELSCVQHFPVTLCHATASPTNPFNLLTVDDDAVFKQGHDQHQNDGDIIPSFTYWDKDGQHTFPGQNLNTLYGWGATGSEVLAAGCVIPPPPHNYTVETKFNQLCSGWERYYRILDNGIPVGGWVLFENGQWLDRWKIETIPAKSYVVNLPDQTTVTKDFPAIVEEGRCQDTHKVEFGIGGDCKGWAAWYTIDGGNKVEYATGTWTLPFKLESADVLEYDFTKNSGELYSISKIPAQGIKESEKCQLTHKVTWKIVPDCDGWIAYYYIDGVETAYDKGSWTKPFELEEATAPAHNFPMNDGELYDNKVIPAQGVKEQANCQVEHKVTSGVVNNCNGWIAWYSIDDNGNRVVYATGTWSDIYVLESANVPEKAIPTNPGELYDKTKIDAFTVNEEKSCLVVLDHSAKISIDQNCEGWSASIVTEDDGVATATTITSGSWTDPFILEDALVSYHVVWPDKYEADFSMKVKESEKCLKQVAIIEVTAECIDTKVGSWIFVTVDPKNATVFIFDEEVTSKKTFMVANQNVEYTGKADEGYLFADQKSEMKGEVEKLANCYVKKPKPECPECGPRIEELALQTDDLVTVEYARGECHVCLDGYWGIKTEGTSLYMRSIHPFNILVSVDPDYLTDEGIEHRVVETGKHKVKLTYIDAKPFEGLDGTYYIIDLEKKYTHSNWVAYDTATGKMYEDAWGKGSSYRSWYISCSRTVGAWDITKAGEFTRQFKGPNHYDYVMYLVNNKYMSYSEAQAWVAEYWKQESGIMLLPPKP